MTTLALNVISNQPFELNRLLESCTGNLFDERIIVCAMNQESEEIKEICKKHNAQYFFFKWIKNFSAARNFCLDQTTTEFVMWLDDDDIIKPESYKKLLELKPRLEKEIYLLPYIYSHHADDSIESILPRERIFKRTPAIRWIGAIHEILPACHNFNWTKIDDIPIDHYRRHCADVDRNLEILESEYNKNPTDPRTQFYYSRDLIGNGVEKGIPIMQDYVKSGLGALDDRVAACITLAKHYFDTEQKTAELYLNQAMSLVPGYAEIHYLLGMMYKKTNVDKAILHFEKATQCGINQTLFTQVASYYSFLPNSELSVLYFAKGEFKKALQANVRSYQAQANIGLASDRKLIFQKLSLKVGWFTGNDITYPVTRIHYNISAELKKFNIQVEITNTISDYHAIVFTHFSQPIKEFKGYKIFHICEDYSDPILNEVDCIISCSTKLKEKLESKGFKNITVIKDPYE